MEKKEKAKKKDKVLYQLIVGQTWYTNQRYYNVISNSIISGCGY